MSLPKTAWCSPSNPQGTCAPIFLGGAEVCKPMDSATLAVFNRLQAAVNTLLGMDGKQQLRIDGRLGPKTTSAVNLYVSNKFSDCNALASVADSVIEALRATASSRASEAAKRGIPVSQAKVPQASVATAGLPIWPAVLLFGGLGTFLYYQDKKSKGVKKPIGGWF